jgi:uncharacterized membrane protein YjgN (DUF898 family)
MTQNILSQADELALNNESTSDAQPIEYELEFHGDAREYFRIWIVNLCLSLLTLGIFSAWAKVRKKRYLYSHTTLDGTPFQYLAKPIPILKGRILAAIVFLAYYASINYFTFLVPYVLPIALVLAPWIVVRSASFNTRYSAFRNMTFKFHGSYWGAARKLYRLGLIPLIVICIMIREPWALTVMGLLVAVFGFSFPWWLRNLKKFIIDNISYGGQRGNCSAPGSDFFGFYFLAGVMVMAGGIAIFLIGLFIDVEVFAIVQPLLAYLIYLIAFVYLQARIGNLVWNNSSIGPIRFRATFRAREMAKLYITNTLAIIASVGILIPWAVVRTIKYRVDNLKVMSDGDISVFQGSETDSVQAAGVELGDFFNMDFSI